MHRFYVSSQNISSAQINILDKRQIRHIKDALRLKTKDKVTLFDKTGNEYIAEIEKISFEGINLRIKQSLSFKAAKKFLLTVACAIPKKAKMADIIDKLTQLGVDRIIPLKTVRVVVKLDKEKEMVRWRRWNKIALSASQQAKRNTLPIVNKIKDMGEVLSDSENFDLKLIPTLSGERKSLKEVFNNLRPNNVLIFIGPEGDFTDEEIALAKRAGCIPVSLGELVLRVDTAAIAVASVLNYVLK